MDRRSFALALSLVSTAVACDEPPDLALPDASVVESYYDYAAGLGAEVRGNVAVITVTQPAEQIRRGGALWAKVGPYVFLFTEETHRLFEDYPGLAGVRVVTRIADGPEVASALLARDALSGILWRRALNIAGRARRDGTDQVTLLQDLVRWGETHTEYEYNERYTRRR